MTKQTVSRYILDARKMKRLPDLECNICKQRLQIGDVVVRKHRKVFHEHCWDSSWIDIPDDILTPEEEYLVENGFYPNESIPTTSTISLTVTIQSSS
jgi:hypothetical protein